VFSTVYDNVIDNANKNWIIIGKWVLRVSYPSERHEASLSRRDWMKVAWHEVPGTTPNKRPVSQRRYYLLCCSV